MAEAARTLERRFQVDQVIDAHEAPQSRIKCSFALECEGAPRAGLASADLVYLTHDSGADCP